MHLMYFAHAISSPTCFGTPQYNNQGAFIVVITTLSNGPLYLQLQRLPDDCMCGVPKHVAVLTTCEEYI
jgi:hypothetical protein